MQRSALLGGRTRLLVALVGACVIVTLACLCAQPAEAQAKTVRNFSLGQTITGYDWTGDGKADTLRTSYISEGAWQAQQGEFSGVVVYLNGKKAYTLKDTYGYRSEIGMQVSRIQLVPLSGKKVVVSLVTMFEDGDGSCTILKASKGKFKKIGNPLKSFYRFGGHNSAFVKSVKGNKLTVSYSSMSYSLGLVDFNLKYAYKSGKVQQAQTSFAPKTTRKLSRTWTLWQSKNVYRSATGKRVKAHLAKGKKVEIVKMYLSKDHKANAVKVKWGKKSGWLKGYSHAHYKVGKSTARYGLFKQVFYAG